MDNNPESVPATSEQQPDRSLAIRAMKIAAYPIAGASGIWAAKVAVHNRAYDTAKSLGMFNDILEKVTPKSEEIIQKRNAGLISAEEAYKQSIDIKKLYQAAAETRMKEHFLNSFKKKWNYMQKAGQQDVVIIGATVAGIAIGALLTIANSKTLTDMFAGSSKENKAR